MTMMNQHHTYTASSSSPPWRKPKKKFEEVPTPKPASQKRTNYTPSFTPPEPTASHNRTNYTPSFTPPEPTASHKRTNYIPSFTPPVPTTSHNRTNYTPSFAPPVPTASQPTNYKSNAIPFSYDSQATTTARLSPPIPTTSHDTIYKTSSTTDPEGSAPKALVPSTEAILSHLAKNKFPGVAPPPVPPPRPTEPLPPPVPSRDAEPEKEESRGHHIGHFLPKEELNKFLPKNMRKPEKPKEEPKIDESNIGHKLLQKMGWKAGTGLGSDGGGITKPIEVVVKNDKSGVGTEDPTVATGSDDVFDLYRKRMMHAYKHRPNPLNNPRRQYY